MNTRLQWFPVQAVLNTATLQDAIIWYLTCPFTESHGQLMDHSKRIGNNLRQYPDGGKAAT